MIDRTFENVVELLVKVHRERDEALERCGRLNQQIFEMMMERKELAEGKSAVNNEESK